jgi:protocatechuate 3,4-dioxygenase beta subunit
MRTIKILTGIVLAASIIAVAALILLENPNEESTDLPSETAGSTPSTASADPRGTADEASVLTLLEPEATRSETVRVYGTVFDAKTSAPIPGAQVATRFGMNDASAVSDANGAFNLEARPADKVPIDCRADGYVPSESTYSGIAGDSVRLDFQLRPGSSVAGTVTDKQTGAPVEGVVVRLLGSQENVFDLLRQRGSGEESSRSGTTGDNGQYRITGIPPASYRVTVDTGDTGFLFKSEDAQSLEVAEESDYEGLDFALTPGGTVSGTVTTATGQTVGDVAVMLMPVQMLQATFRGLDALDPGSFQPKRAYTEADGTYTIRGVEYGTELRAIVRSGDFATSRSEPFSLDPSIPSIRVDLTLTSGSAIEGIARYPDGTPANAVRLLLLPASSENWQGFMGPGVSATDPDGIFQFKHVNAGTYLLRPEHELVAQSLRKASEPLSVTVDGQTDIAGLEIVVQPDPEKMEGEGMIAGVVLDPSGAPAANVRVDARRVDNPRETAGTTTETDGTFELTKLRGMVYDVSVDDAIGIAEEPTVTVGSEITIQLEAPASVSGVVVTASGEPVPGATVQLKDLAEQGPEPNIEAIMRGLFRRGEGGESTDAYGRFEFTKIAPGDYEVAAKTASQGTAKSDPLSLSPGMDFTELQLVLDPGVSFSGIVVGSDGAPVQGAHVQLTPSGEDPTADMMSQFLPAAMLNPVGSTTSDANGAFTINNVPPGTYQLVASHSAYAKTTMPNVQVASGRPVTGYRVTLGKGGNAQGKYTIDGKPQPGAMIMIVGPAGFEMVQTDSQGLFDVSGLSSGSYMIAAIDPSGIATAGQGVQFKPQVVDIVDGEVTDVDLGDASGVPVTGLVSGAGDGLTVVALRRPGGPSLESLDLTNLGNLFDSMRYLAGQATVAPDGSFTIDGVEPGDYVLEVYSLDIGQNGPDLNALMNMPRTPVYQQNVTIGSESPVLNIPLGG